MRLPAPHRAAIASIVAALFAATAAPATPPGDRGLPVCPDILADLVNCQIAQVSAAANFSVAVPGGFRTADDVKPSTSNPTRLCWIGRYMDRQVPAVADESFHLRIFNTVNGLPDLASGPIFARTFSQTGAPGLDQLEIGCLDGQNCPGTITPATGGHYVYSIEVAGGLPMSALTCYFVEITCVGSAAAGRVWAWTASAFGTNFRSYQAIDGQYTAASLVANDRALCLSGGVSPFHEDCGTTAPPPVCQNDPANGQAHDGVTVSGMRSSSVGSIGRPSGPGAWTPLQHAENFQVSAPVAVTNTCFTGFYLGIGCQGSFQAPPPTHDIEFYADVDGLPGGPAPIASFRIGTTPGVSYVWDGDELVSATHPPVPLEPGRCYWLSISRLHIDIPSCLLVWHWRLTTSASPAADRVFASRDVTNPPAAWQPLTVDQAGDTSISNFVYLLNGGPVAAPICGDCNGNGIADAAEIALNSTLDCFDRTATFGRGDADGILDACQCRADWNRDGAVNSADISTYLQIWLIDILGHGLPADMTCDGATNTTDISTFLTVWIASLTGQSPHDRCP